MRNSRRTKCGVNLGKGNKLYSKDKEQDEKVIDEDDIEDDDDAQSSKLEMKVRFPVLYHTATMWLCFFT